MAYVERIVLYFSDGDMMMFCSHLIGDILIDDITTDIVRVSSKYIAKTKKASYVGIEIFSEGDDVFNKETGVTKFQRIQQHKDIYNIAVIYTDKTMDIYVVESFDPKRNVYQHTYLSSYGNLYIGIGKNMSLKKLFPNAENKEHIEKYKSAILKGKSNEN